MSTNLAEKEIAGENPEQKSTSPRKTRARKSPEALRKEAEREKDKYLKKIKMAEQLEDERRLEAGRLVEQMNNTRWKNYDEKRFRDQIARIFRE